MFLVKGNTLQPKAKITRDLFCPSSEPRRDTPCMVSPAKDSSFENKTKKIDKQSQGFGIVLLVKAEKEQKCL